jgi:hypothetical protein
MSDLRDIATLCKEIDYLTAQVETLRKDRDELRREVCYAIYEAVEASCNSNEKPCTLREIAEERGWDCYKGLIQ